MNAAEMERPDAHAGATHDAPDAKAGKAAWYALFVLCVVTLMRWVDQVVLVVGLEPMRKSLGLTDVQLGMLQGVGIQLAAAVGAIPLAWLADRFDRRKVLAVCIFAWSAATVWRAYAMSFHELMASTMGMAIADAALIPVAYALLPLLFRGRQLARANLLFYAAGSLAYAIAMLFAGAIFKAIDAHQDALPSLIRHMESWRSASFIVGSLGPLFCLMVLRIQAVQSPGAPARALAGHAQLSPAPAITLRAFARVHWRALASIHGSTICLILGLGPLATWISPAIARRFGLEPAEVGVQLGGLFIGGTLGGMLLAAWLQKVLGRQHGILAPVRAAPVMTVLAVIPTAAIGLADSRIGIYACIVFIMLTLTTYNAGMPTVYQKLVPAVLRARVMALAISAVTAMSAAGPVLVGYISDLIHGDNSLLASIALVGTPATLAAAGLLAWGRRHVRAAVSYAEQVDDGLLP